MMGTMSSAELFRQLEATMPPDVAAGPIEEIIRRFNDVFAPLGFCAPPGPGQAQNFPL
jgi:hypothetical protein